jgi:predicted nucleic acid-binding Zn ribbon protein
MPSSRGWRDGERPRSKEPAALGEVVAGVLRQRPFATGVSVGRLGLAWADVVGPRLAEESAPARLEGGTLVVEARSGAWGAQLQFLSEDIRRRANETLGGDQVERVRVVVAPGAD